MYLAEDRILCLKIFTHPNYTFKLKYIRDALAKVDAATNLINIIA